MSQAAGLAEPAAYACVWIGAVAYAIYSVHVATYNYFRYYDDVYNDFSPGWSLLNRKLDVSDEEWKIWIPLVFKLVPWVVVHVFISQLLKHILNNKTIVCCWYIFISCAFLYCHYGLLSTMCTLLLPCISCLLTSFRSKSISWLVHCITLAFIYWAKVSDIVFREWLMLEDEQYFMITTAICWIQLKSISYSIDSIETYKHVNVDGFFKDLLQNLAYCLYLPTLFLGPIILYQEFLNGINKPIAKWSQKRLINIILNLVRYIFWMYFTEFCLHFVYFNALKFHTQAVQRLEPWAFYGVGYCMGQYFLNKYVVIYGLTSTICRADDIDAPPQPKCIGRIHLYSDMWKHFDRGLYKFLLRYIYIPCNPRSPVKKVFASALCFTFIYIWHGMHLYIFLWSLLNFLGLLIENIVRSGEEYFYKGILHNCLSRQNKQRLECALSSPLLALSAISNFYFFAEEDIGNIYFSRIFHESWESILILMFVLYCCCQTSTEIKKLDGLRVNKDEKTS